MVKPKQNLSRIVACCAILAGASILLQKAGADQADGKDNLQQAADSIVAVAKERVAAARTDDEAIQRARLSDQALSIIGKLGEFDTSPQSDALLTSYRAGGHPIIVDAVVQLRLANELRNWEELNEMQHAAAINRFVSDVKKTGLTRGQAEMLVRVANMLGDGDDSKLIASAMGQIIPLARASKDAEIKRIVPLYEGTQRRLNLVGKPIEIDGTLLGGSKINWESYRGKVVLVDFFASFCDPCRAEVPNVLENYRAYHDKGFDVIGVNLDTNPKMCQLYMDQTGFKFPTIFGDAPNAAGWDLPLARKYGITRIPRVILVDQNGNVVSTMARGERLGELLAQLLGPSSRSATRPGSRASSRSEDPAVNPAGGVSLESGGVVPASFQEEVNPVEPAPVAPEPPK
jgi:thiol-disulfide isomerase/thioredoxin